MAGPVHAQTDVGGSRWYVHPITGERFISVTTVLGNIAKFGLLDWAARLTASAAFTQLPLLTKASRAQPCNSTLTDDACGVCQDCVQAWLADRHNEVRDQAGERGSRLHEAAEHLALFGDGIEVDEATRPLLERYNQWLRVYRPTFEASEMTVISRKWGYAGTLDAILRLAGDAPIPARHQHLLDAPLLVDYKTSKYVNLTWAWQVNAYAHADVVLLPDGQEAPMPPVTGGLVLHVRPDQVQMREVVLSDANQAAFIYTLRMTEALAGGLGSGLSRPIKMPQQEA